MQKIITKTILRKYSVIIDRGAFDHKNNRGSRFVKDFFSDAEKIALVTNDKILGIYRKKIDIFLSDTGKDFKVISFPDGEKEKNLKNCEKLYHELLDFNVHRKDLLIAFGGGVIGDLAGFAASTFHRGIRLIQFPTTIISQVDSSIGGKVVVNLDNFKNIIGSFYQPHAVIIDPVLLSTLEEREIINGLAEILKYAIVFDKKIIKIILSIMEELNENDREKLFKLINHNNFEKILFICCKIKAKIVSIDEFDFGLRNLLNFGHTFGHAIEKVSELKGVNHGMAVAMGMIVAIDISIKLGLTRPELKEEIIKLYKILKLPYQVPALDSDKIISALRYDKKSTARSNKFILLKGLNKPLFYYNIDEELIKRTLNENMSS